MSTLLPMLMNVGSNKSILVLLLACLTSARIPSRFMSTAMPLLATFQLHLGKSIQQKACAIVFVRLVRELSIIALTAS
ncbi:hypothetical protein BT69DRAFT_816803 [Atractiella rhizophila]|nr:hypothetical protein BT69DRAFT_816803 [Atractiella rhizophila]